MRMDHDMELKLLAGLPVDLGNGLLFGVPTLRTIAGIGSRKYDALISVLLVNRASLEEPAASRVTNFELFLINSMLNEEFWHKAKQGLELFFGMEPTLRESPDGAHLYFGDDPDMRLDDGSFDYFQSLIMYSHNIQFQREQFSPGNAKAKALIEKLQKGKQEILSRKEQIFDLVSKISGVAWKSSGVNIFNVFDLTIFQFYDALNRLEQVDYYLFTLQGIYSGHVDGQKINLSNIHWSKKYKT
ncbi:hypothetical protein B0G52_11253 [Cohnella sp. SGD-V74]|nr:hypothetical protein B0G52_11253 [Cohnella sp. SGD-V74]